MILFAVYVKQIKDSSFEMSNLKQKEEQLRSLAERQLGLTSQKELLADQITLKKDVVAKQNEKVKEKHKEYVNQKSLSVEKYYSESRRQQYAREAEIIKPIYLGEKAKLDRVKAELLELENQFKEIAKQEKEAKKAYNIAAN